MDRQKFGYHQKALSMTTKPNTTETSPIETRLKNTAAAFAYKSDGELRKAAWLFGQMKRKWLVDMGSKLTLWTIRIPFVQWMVKNTVFDHFCGGTTLSNAAQKINKLGDFKVDTILDYGAEGKETDEDFNLTTEENLRAITFAANNPHISVVSTKVTGMARFSLLEAIQEGKVLSQEDQLAYQNVIERLDTICSLAHQHNIAIYIDAEESWIQSAIDQLVILMMQRYNKEKAIVFNTFQMYRHDRLQFLKDTYQQAQRDGYVLGAKLVRGAYMDKERERAAQMGYPSPINPDKAATDQSFNAAVRFCLEHYQTMAVANASHNEYSNALQAQLMEENNIPRNHPNISFCQLYGMSDHITFNLAQDGFNVAKYMPYGPVRDVIPYLIRRAQENTSVTGEVGRELDLISAEVKRRHLTA